MSLYIIAMRCASVLRNKIGYYVQLFKDTHPGNDLCNQASTSRSASDAHQSMLEFSC